MKVLRTSADRRVRLHQFTDEMLKAVVRGRFDDPASEEMLAKFLIDRREAIFRRYLPAVNPIRRRALRRYWHVDIQERRREGRGGAGGGWKLIGFERVPAGSPPATERSRRSPHSSKVP